MFEDFMTNSIQNVILLSKDTIFIWLESLYKCRIYETVAHMVSNYNGMSYL